MNVYTVKRAYSFTVDCASLCTNCAKISTYILKFLKFVLYFCLSKKGESLETGRRQAWVIRYEVLNPQKVICIPVKMMRTKFSAQILIHAHKACPCLKQSTSEGSVLLLSHSRLTSLY